VKKHTQLIIGLSFVLRRKAIHQKLQWKNGERVNKGMRGEREIYITGYMQDLIGSVANNGAVLVLSFA